MADDTAKSALERVARLLLDHGVEFVVVGGHAEVLHGSPRVTYDVDLCYARTKQNLENLAKALRSLHPTLRGAPEDLPFKIDSEALALGCNFTFGTALGDLDLLGYLEPLGGYDVISKNAEVIEIDGMMMKVIALDDLITIKEYLQRPKDRQGLLQLLAIRQMRNDGAR